MTEDFKKEISLIKKYKFHQGLLSELIGINQGSFSDKIRGLRGAKFTESQKIKIINFLKELELSINNL